MARYEDIDKLEIISRSLLFAGVGIPEQHVIAEKCRILRFPPGHIIVEQGEPATSLYIMASGEAEAFRYRPTSGWHRVKVFRTYDSFGELAILKSIPRVARVVSVTSSIFLNIDATHFLDIYQYFPEKARDNIQIIIAKLIALEPRLLRKKHL